MAQEPVHKWDLAKVSEWLSEKGFAKYTLKFSQQKIDGKALMLLNETDLKTPPLSIDYLGDVKRLWLEIRQLKLDSQQTLIDHGYDPHTLLYFSKGITNMLSPGFSSNRFEDHLMSSRYSDRTECENQTGAAPCFRPRKDTPPSSSWTSRRPSYPDQLVSLRYTALDGVENDYLHPQSSRSSEDGHATLLQPEVWKALIALAYCFVVTWITAFVMVIVHDRVPDMKKYPPLPDIFLDNVPHIPWAFHMCEWTGTVLLLIWLSVLLVHKHRFILLRRFFALSGTVFLLRCITMLITSLSVPGTHLECNPRPNIGDGEFDIFQKMRAAYRIWKGAGMSIQGVRTCGDYMFSGHTVALTMLNFFITEYSPRDVYLLHTFSWLLNMFGIFFILSGHEHYSIDVFIAFYISSRLFLYYHTLANNQSLMQRDQGRTRIWFPLFSFFESDVDGIVPNEYESPLLLLQNLTLLLKETLKRIAFLFISNLSARPSTHHHPTRKHKRKTQ